MVMTCILHMRVSGKHPDVSNFKCCVQGGENQSCKNNSEHPDVSEMPEDTPLWDNGSPHTRMHHLAPYTCGSHACY
jgi:hypothetical protein